MTDYKTLKCCNAVRSYDTKIDNFVRQLSDISRLKGAVKHRWGAEMPTQGPFILLSDSKKAARD